jgi:hypothetical protein
MVTGGARCGKSTLLAWLIAHGTRPATEVERRVHGFVPLAGRTATTAAWMLADQLSVVARTPGELVNMLARDARRTVIVLPDLHAADDPGAVTELALALLDVGHVRLIVEMRSGSTETEYERLTTVRSAVMDLDETRWTDQERYAEWAAEPRPVAADADTVDEELLDLDDPAAVCAADPWRVSTLYERSGDGHGGLRAAWLRAGASLTREQERADRAVVLLAALGDDADPRLPQALASLTEGAPWRVIWRRVRGDIAPPWTGPTRALAAGRGPLAGQLVVADHQGTIRLLRSEDAVPVGRLSAPVPLPTALAAHPDGTVTTVDAQGRPHTQRGAPTASGTGLSALLGGGATPLEQLLNDVRAYARKLTVTALASADRVLAVADGAGAVHAFTENGADPHTATLHRGPVTALAALDLQLAEGGGPVPVLYSGGVDGTVRTWAPHADPMASPVLSRPCAVTALAVAATEGGPVLATAWADGLVEHRALDSDTVRRFRPGIHVNAVVLTSAEQMIVGTDETLVCLRLA